MYLLLLEVGETDLDFVLGHKVLVKLKIRSVERRVYFWDQVSGLDVIVAKQGIVVGRFVLSAQPVRNSEMRLDRQH